RLQAGRRIVADVGLRFFVRRDFDRSTTVRYPRLDEQGIPLVDENGVALSSTISRPGRTRIAQVGPTCSIVWPLMQHARLRLDGWLNIQRITQRLYGALPEGSESAIERAGSRGDTRVIPNVAMSILWNL
ncbi:MAG TPA: hypothetical protein VF190_16080, partial [Rhodothermales bacterium]